MHKTTTILKFSDEMHHCSSIAQDKKGNFVVALYYGQECTDDQRVTIALYNQSQVLLDRIDLGYKTGNPIVWNEDGKIMIIYSYFSDAEEDGTPLNITRPVERWMYCTNYIGELVTKEGKIELKDAEEIKGAYGQVMRCQPIFVDGKTLIPSYREKDPWCYVWEYSDGQMTLKSDFGEVDTDNLKQTFRYSYLGKGVAIQPTLLYQDGKLLAFCRNVCRPADQMNDNTKVWTTVSYDKGKTWDLLREGGIPNHNNSIVVIPNNINGVNNKSAFLLFNSNRRRNDMILHEAKTQVSMNLAMPLLGDRRSYSYPNYMWDKKGALHVVHTNCCRIAWHIFDKDYLDEAFKIPTNTTGPFKFKKEKS